MKGATLQGRVEDGKACFKKALAAQAHCCNAEGPSPSSDAEDDWETGVGILPLPHFGLRSSDVAKFVWRVHPLLSNVMGTPCDGTCCLVSRVGAEPGSYYAT